MDDGTQWHWPSAKCRLIVEPEPLSGQANMDADAALLDRVASGDDSVFVRIYRWSEPTVSLGYFQSLDEQPPEGLEGCPRVKRLTGGGAILHHHELTYSCVVPASHPVRHSPLQLYVAVHSAIISLLDECGVEACLRGDSQLSESEPWLCFLRQDPRDIVVGQDKVVGSAQRRRRGHILQHGSILLRRSHLIPDVPGLQDLRPSVGIQRFCDALGSTLIAAISRFE